MGLLAPLCEEVAFRGLILNGLFRSFKPWTAVLLSSFLFAIYKANVFQFIPIFVLGVVLAMFTARSRSILPAIMFHCVGSTLLLVIVSSPLSVPFGVTIPLALRILVAGLFLLIALCLLGRLWIRGYRFFDINDPALSLLTSNGPKSIAHAGNDVDLERRGDGLRHLEVDELGRTGLGNGDVAGQVAHRDPQEDLGRKVIRDSPGE
jgi:hypothetical protein